MRLILIATVLLLTITGSANATVTQPNGHTSPVDAMNQEVQLYTFFTQQGDTLDWQADATDSPGTFYPYPDGTVQLGLRQSAGSPALAWYNDAPGQTSPPAAGDLHVLIPSNASLGTEADASTIRSDPAWTGGAVGFALLGSQTHYSDRRHDPVCIACSSPGPWALAIEYVSGNIANRRYLAFEDGTASMSSFNNDGDFNDDVFIVTHMPAAVPAACANFSDDDGDGNVDAADRGCYSGAGGTYAAGDDDESDDPPAAKVSLPATPTTAATITATVVSAGTGVASCVLAIDADGNGSFETDLTTTTASGKCTAAAPTGLKAGDYPVRATLTETAGAATTATGVFRVLTQCTNAADDDGDGLVDAADRGCYSGPGGAYAPSDDTEADDPALPGVTVAVSGGKIVATVTSAGTGFGQCAITLDGTALTVTKASGPPITCTADVPTGLAAGDHAVVATLTETAGKQAKATTTAVAPSPSPAPPPAPAPLLLACSGRSIQLTDVSLRGAKVHLAGLTVAGNAGKTVSAGGGTATVAADGTFALDVKAPSRSRRGKVRYQATIGAATSSRLKLGRRFTVISLSGGNLVAKVLGKVKRGTTVEIRRTLTCQTSEVFKRVRLSKSGRLTVRLDTPPAGSAFAFYRAEVKLGHGTTYTLPIVVRAAGR